MALDEQSVLMFEHWRERAEALLGGPCELKGSAPRLYQGWKLDEWTWLVERDGEPVILTTDHGNLLRAEPRVVEDDIVRYENALQAARDFLARLSPSDIR